MDVRFVIVAPPSKRGSLNLKLPILIGRAEEAKFRIRRDSVSRRHCEVFIKEGGVYVRDLGSTNGTFLDGEQVTAAVASFVPPAGEIRIGGVAFRVEYTPATAAPVPEDDTASLDTLPVERPPIDATVPEPIAEALPAAADALDDVAEDEPAVEEPAIEEPAEAAPPPFGLPAVDDPIESAADGSEAGPEAEADDNLTDFFKSLK
jgi:predicted component of type VI protein secretion system